MSLKVVILYTLPMYVCMNVSIYLDIHIYTYFVHIQTIYKYKMVMYSCIFNILKFELPMQDFTHIFFQRIADKQQYYQLSDIYLHLDILVNYFCLSSASFSLDFQIGNRVIYRCYSLISQQKLVFFPVSLTYRGLIRQCK